MENILTIEAHGTTIGFSVTENTSDGYHTFKELYEYRKFYNALFVNFFVRTDYDFDIHKSKKHSDGELCFNGEYFIVVVELPTGQISNHYKIEDWDLFQIPEKDIPNTFDGHTSQDVLNRMKSFLRLYPF